MKKTIFQLYFPFYFEKNWEYYYIEKLYPKTSLPLINDLKFNHKIDTINDSEKENKNEKKFIENFEKYPFQEI
ncbi:hypothetical protein M0811_13476 [Anaeramoeba ignava]|uniref:Uncharacterized protein n=1 Tax=Anaeramoeba ignava TaxID=1746090 RepID=A0A9Q0L5N8_ANAIG|nr:hypothetical protein M0811_13476 [Anaeramoeba ignava]